MASAMIFGHLLEDLTDGVTVFREGVGKPMPLTSTDIDIDIAAGLAVVVITRVFSNNEDVPIEAILTMPVGFNAVVTGLVAHIDGRRLRAVARLKEVARRSYETALDDGKLAVLHEEALRGIHVLSVGQLAPGKEVKVELRLVVPLATSDAGPFLRLPMTAGQLYGSTPLQPADDLITDAQVRHVASVTVRVDTGVPKLLCRGGLEPGESLKLPLDRAIEIVVEGGQFGTRMGVSATGHQVCVDLRPQQRGTGALKLAIVVDRSGSTSSSIGNGSETVLSAMRRGLTEALSDTNEEDHIALWQFSDGCQRLGTGRGAEILHILKKLDEPSGGTRLGAAIRKVAESGIQDILVLTDGQTWDALAPLASELGVRISAVLVGKASLDAKVGHLCALTGGDLFYAPEAEVGPCVRSALNSKRSSAVLRDIEVCDGQPSLVRRCLGGVNITASWSNAMEVGSGSDIGRFAAWLCLGQLGEEKAMALSLIEGLCSQATSLVLVDEAGEASSGLSETRKVPLMADSMSSISTSERRTQSDPGIRFMMRETTLEERTEAFAARPHPEMLRKRLNGIRAGAPMTGSKSSRLSQIGGESTTSVAYDVFNLQNLATVATGIDWEIQVNRFLEGDFDGLMRNEAFVLDTLARNEELAAVLRNVSLPPIIVLLAWLAMRFVTHSRAAKRFATKALGQNAYGDLASEIEAAIADLIANKAT